MLTVRLVNSLENVNVQTATDGDVYITPNGEYYRFDANQLGGIGSFFKKLGSIALPLVGTIAAPFTGGASLALISAGGAIGGQLLAGGAGGAGGTDVESAAAQISKAIDDAQAAVLNGDAEQFATIQILNRAVTEYTNATEPLKDKKARGRSIVLRNQLWDKIKVIERITPDQIRKPATQAMQTQQTQQVGVTATGQPIYGVAQSNGILGGIDTNTIFLIGGVIAVIWILKK